jgi:tetratricopeptide (TPR) repeat protein
LGNYEKANEYFETYIKKYPKGDLRFQAEKDIGYIFEQQGEYQKAIEQFKSIETKVPSTMKSQLLLAIGRNHENLEQLDNAVEMYQSIIDSNTSVSWKDKAKERLEILRPGSSLPEEESPEQEVTTEEASEQEVTAEETPEQEVAAEETPEQEVTEDNPAKESNP